MSPARRGLWTTAGGVVEHQRLVLGRALGELAADARLARALYAEVDEEVGASVGAAP